MKSIVFTFGRMNSPTYGHKKLIDKIISVAKTKGAEHRIYLSHSYDSIKNPIPYNKKIDFVRKLFPYANIVDDSKAKSIFHVCKILSDNGYRDVTLVVGDDRADIFLKEIQKYIKKPEETGFDKNKHYIFDKFTVISSGQRDPNSSGVEGASGTKMREFVKKGDVDSFIQATPTKNITLARAIYNTIKKNLRENNQPDLDDLQSMIINEDAMYELETECLSEGINDPGIFKAVFLAGGPGSGKDFILHKIIKGTGLTEINSDNAFEMLMRKTGMSLIMRDPIDRKRDEIRSRAKIASSTKNELAIKGRLGLIINSTGGDKSKVISNKEKLENLGYETMMIFVNTTDEVSRDRNISRGRAGGREVPETIRKEKWNEAQENIYYYESVFGPNFYVVDNSEDLRYVSRERKNQIEASFTKMHKAIRSFIAKRPSSRIANDWIAAEASRRNISKFSPAKSNKFEDINDFKPIEFVKNIFGRNRSTEMIKAMKDYRRAVESEKYKGKSFEYIASQISKTYDFNSRDFFNFLRRMGKQGTLPKHYISETNDNLINQLRTAYSNIDRVDPGSEAYKKLINILNSMSLKDLKIISNANIKFVSVLARNRIIRKTPMKEDIEIKKKTIFDLRKNNE